MVRDALRGYLEMASGLTEVTRDKALVAAKALAEQLAQIGSGDGDPRDQVKALTDELAATARANRDLVLGMVRSETDRAVASLGVAREDDVAALRRRLGHIETRLSELEQRTTPGDRLPSRTPPRGGAGPTGKMPPARDEPAQKPPAQKTPAQKPPAQKSTAKKVAPAKTVGKKAPAKKAPATAPAKRPGRPA